MRYCTMPNIPFFRDWFESKFSDLCYMHDCQYAMHFGKFQADRIFVKNIINRGYWWLALPVFLAINLPWVWFNYWKANK